MNIRSNSLRQLSLVLLGMMTLGCGSNDDQAGGTADTPTSSAETPPSSSDGSSKAERLRDIGPAELDLYERGLTKEIELVRAAQERSRTATTPQERGEAMQAAWEDQTIPAAARAIGADPSRYRLVRESVHELMETLDFRGQIDGPMQLDTSRASADVKARLAKDPLAELPPASADAIRARLTRLTPIFVEYVNLTAVGG